MTTQTAQDPRNLDIRSGLLRVSRSPHAWGAAAVVAIAILLILWLMFGGSKEDAIRKVLAADKSASTHAENAVKAGAAVPMTMEQGVVELYAIDLKDCPADFAEAYEKHRLAWKDLSRHIGSSPQSFIGGFFTGLKNNLHGEFDGGYGRMTRERQKHLDAVENSWHDVQKSAAQYGVKVE